MLHATMLLHVLPLAAAASMTNVMEERRRQPQVRWRLCEGWTLSQNTTKTPRIAYTSRLSMRGRVNFLFRSMWEMKQTV